MSELYIGLMSGTSCDGVDASLVRTDGEDNFQAIENLHLPYPQNFREKLKKLCINISPNLYEIEAELTNFHAQAVKLLLKKANKPDNQIKALGFHGQTIFHNAAQGVSVQIGNPHSLAQKTHIDVIHDFRRRDISLGGQGAPLVPIFHKLLTKNYAMSLAVINIGGVANITYIDSQQNQLIAFDTGPGNALIDDVTSKYFSKNYDEGGKIAATGTIDMMFIEEILDIEYFKKPYPKSLDRNEFSLILDKLQLHAPKDIIATLTYFSAASIVKAIEILPKLPAKIFFCGGGGKNMQLISWIKEILRQKHIVIEIENISDIRGCDLDFIESQAFAYIAARFFKKLPSAFPSTTAASQANICGCLVRKL